MNWLYAHANITFLFHDDVIKWKHFPRYWLFVRWIHRSPVNSPHKGQWRGALAFSLICVWINGWVNNRKAGDLSRYRAHYDVTLMYFPRCSAIRYINTIKTVIVLTICQSSSYTLCSITVISDYLLRVNTSTPSAANMRRWTGSALIQVMACRLYGA